MIFGINAVQLGALTAIAHALAVYGLWWRVERLRSSPGLSKGPLPQAASFMTGGVVLWIWGGDYRRVRDSVLSGFVLVARGLLVAALALLVAAATLGY